MKRSAMPARSTPLRRTGPPEQRSPLAQQSVKAKARGLEYRKVRRWVRSRANELCEVQISGVCAGRGEHAHHILMRSQGGGHEVGNLLWVCLPCHDHIHANPAWSYERGFLRRGVTADAGWSSLAAIVLLLAAVTAVGTLAPLWAAVALVGLTVPGMSLLGAVWRAEPESGADR